MNKTKSNIWWIIAGVICVVILIFLMCVYFFDSTVSHVEWIQVMLTAALVSVTAF